MSEKRWTCVFAGIRETIRYILVNMSCTVHMFKVISFMSSDAGAGSGKELSRLKSWRLRNPASDSYMVWKICFTYSPRSESTAYFGTLHSKHTFDLNYSCLFWLLQCIKNTVYVLYLQVFPDSPLSTAWYTVYICSALHSRCSFHLIWLKCVTLVLPMQPLPPASFTKFVNCMYYLSPLGIK